MTMRMLIDARHREETRVAVVKGNRIEEFDFESAEHNPAGLSHQTSCQTDCRVDFVLWGLDQ